MTRLNFGSDEINKRLETSAELLFEGFQEEIYLGDDDIFDRYDEVEIQVIASTYIPYMTIHPVIISRQQFSSIKNGTISFPVQLSGYNTVSIWTEFLRIEKSWDRSGFHFYWGENIPKYINIDRDTGEISMYDKWCPISIVTIIGKRYTK